MRSSPKQQGKLVVVESGTERCFSCGFLLFPLTQSPEDAGSGDSERTWKPEDKRSSEVSAPRGTKGTKRAYDLALKAFQDLAREVRWRFTARLSSKSACLLRSDINAFAEFTFPARRCRRCSEA